MRVKAQTVKLAFKHAFAAVFLVLSLAGPGAAAPFEDADAAYGGGNYAVAVRLWFPQGVAEAQRRFLAEAQYRLGVLYYVGHGVPQNYAEALRWWSLAANQGLDRAQFSLGVLYENGQGVPKDYSEAAKWYRLAANQGVDRAQFALGNLYADGRRDVPQSYAEALKWWKLAADQGLDQAQFRLGVAHDLGNGVPKDAVSAQMWLYLAAAQGDENARRHRDILEKEMTPAQIAEAQKLAREWKPTKQPPRFEDQLPTGTVGEHR